MDAATGRVLFAQEADRQSLIASITKVMTGLLICEDGDLGRTVTVPPEAVGVEGSSLYLKLGEQLTVEQLLYGLMLRSGNDAAVALAVTADGTAERFVARMNRRAAELGLADKVIAGGWRSLTAKESGRIGGLITKKKRELAQGNNH